MAVSSYYSEQVKYAIDFSKQHLKEKQALLPSKIDTGQRVRKEILKGVRYLSELSSNTTSLAHICRVGITSLAVVEKYFGFSKYYTRVDRHLQLAEAAINTFGFGDQIESFGTKQYLKERIFTTLGKGALLLAGIGGVCVLIGRVARCIFEQMKHMPATLKKMGKHICPIISAVAGLGFGLIAVDKAVGLALAKTSQEKINSMLGLAWNVSESALAFFSAWIGFAEGSLRCFSATRVPYLIALGTLAAVTAGLGIAAAVYQISHQGANKQSG